MKIGILGISYDEKSSFLRGAAKGPKHIRQALVSESSNAFAEDGTNINDLDIHDYGDYPVKDYFDIIPLMADHLQKRDKLLTYGGDHSITFPIIQAYAEYYDTFDILQIDAHSDLYDEFEGDKYSHACPFARIMEKGLCQRLVQVGVRTLTTEQRDQAAKYAVEIIEMKDFSLDRIPVFERPLYLSVDLDGIDPAFAPGVSHWEPGGLTGRQVIDIIQGISVPIIGADIVEYNPSRDNNQITAFLAAKLSKEILVKMAR